MSAPAEEITPPVLAETLMRASAGFGIRFGARLIDTVYGIVLGGLFGLVLGVALGILIATGKVPHEAIEALRHNAWHSYGLGILGSYLYISLCEGICGTTIGKLACGLNVVRVDGSPCTLAAAFKRDLLYHWDALFFGLVGYNSMEDSPTSQRYGDRWADTVVVKTDRFTPGKKRPSWRLPVGLLAGSLAWLVCQTLAMLLKIL